MEGVDTPQTDMTTRARAVLTKRKWSVSTIINDKKQQQKNDVEKKMEALEWCDSKTVAMMERQSAIGTVPGTRHNHAQRTPQLYKTMHNTEK